LEYSRRSSKVDLQSDPFRGRLIPSRTPDYQADYSSGFRSKLPKQNRETQLRTGGRIYA
jgi:hypothetical protein